MDKKNVWHKTAGKQLAKMRMAAGLTQVEAARSLKYGSGQFISNWERGISLPPIHLVPQLADLYMVSRVDILKLVFGVREQALRAARADAMAKLQRRA